MTEQTRPAGEQQAFESWWRTGQWPTDVAPSAWAHRESALRGWLSRAALAQQPAAQAAGLTDAEIIAIYGEHYFDCVDEDDRDPSHILPYTRAIERALLSRAAPSGEADRLMRLYVDGLLSNDVSKAGDATRQMVGYVLAAPQPTAQQAEQPAMFGGGAQCSEVSSEHKAEQPAEEARGVDEYAVYRAWATARGKTPTIEGFVAWRDDGGLLAAPAAGTGQAARVAELVDVLRAVDEQFRRFGDRFPDGFDARVFRWVRDALAGTAPQADTGAQGLTWTSVNDRLPRLGTGERVLIYTEGADFAGEQFFDIKADDLYPSQDGEQDARTEVAAAATHWMPLPLPGFAILTQASTGAQGLTEAQVSTIDELLQCFLAWDKDVRVLGNIRAEDAANALRAILAQAAPGAAAMQRDAERYRAIRSCGSNWEDLPVLDGRGGLDADALDQAADSLVAASKEA